MKKQILPLLLLCLTLLTNARDRVWTVTNTNPVVAEPQSFYENVFSGSLQYCVTNMDTADVVVFDASLSGATILFNAELVAPAKALTIDASMLAEPVIFDGQETTRILYLGVSNTVKARLYTIKGITFQNGKNTAGTAHAAALTAYNDLHVEKCKFINNVNTMSSGSTPGAIYQARRNTVNVIRDCTFKNNKAGYRGGAMIIAQAQALIERCSFIGNEVLFTGTTGAGPSSGTGAVLHMPNLQGADVLGTFVEFRNCTMVNNYASGVQGTVIYNETAFTDATLTTLRPTYSYLRLINCTVYGNSCNADENIGRSAIYSTYRKIVVGGCLMANNNLESVSAADIRMANVEPLLSLGSNTYNNFRHWSSTVRDEYKHASDSLYTNLQWYDAPLSSVVNEQGVMVPIKTNESLFNTYIQRIPLDSLISWHGASPVDQLGMPRNSTFGTVGAYHVSTSTGTKNLSLSNDKIGFDGNMLSVSDVEGCKLNIYNITGMQVYSGIVSSVNFVKDISAFEKGIYMIQLTDGIRNVAVRKIMK